MPQVRKGQQLPDQDHVVRHVPWKGLRKDEQDNVIGILGASLAPRQDEDGVSVSHLEFHSGNKTTQLENTAKLMRGCRDIRPKCHFAIGKIDEIKRHARDAQVGIKIVCWPTQKNPAHAEIRNLPASDMELLEALAEEVFTEIVRNSSIR